MGFRRQSVSHLKKEASFVKQLTVYLSARAPAPFFLARRYYNFQNDCSFDLFSYTDLAFKC